MAAPLFDSVLGIASHPAHAIYRVLGGRCHPGLVREKTGRGRVWNNQSQHTRHDINDHRGLADTIAVHMDGQGPRRRYRCGAPEDSARVAHVLLDQQLAQILIIRIGRPLNADDVKKAVVEQPQGQLEHNAVELIFAEASERRLTIRPSREPWRQSRRSRAGEMHRHGRVNEPPLQVTVAVELLIELGIDLTPAQQMKWRAGAPSLGNLRPTSANDVTCRLCRAANSAPAEGANRQIQLNAMTLPVPLGKTAAPYSQPAHLSSRDRICRPPNECILRQRFEHVVK
jgi:hypothetical protein